MDELEKTEEDLGIGRTRWEEGKGVEGMSGYGKDGWEREGRMYAHSCESNALTPQTVVGRKRPSFAILFCFFVPRIVVMLIRCHVCHA